MKIKFLIAGFLGMATTAAFAQKYEVSNAKETYENYLKLNQVAATFQQADKSINDAKASIDNASKNAKTAQLPVTYALKAAIYSQFALRDSLNKTAYPTAEEAYKKGKELDATGENKKYLDDALKTMSQYQLDRGVKAYQTKNYDAAYKAFDTFAQFVPGDTTALFYSGVAASAGGNFAAANTAFAKLLPLNFSQKQTVYLKMQEGYLLMKDTVNALKIVTEGVEKLPGSADLRRREIEISLQTGKGEEILGKIQTAIANDPKNKALYFYSGLIQTTSANTIGDEIRKLRRTAKDDPKAIMALVPKIDPLQAKRNDYFAKAAEQFKKALEIDPDFFEANSNLGLALLSPAIDLYNYANNYLPASKQKEYNAAMTKSAAEFEEAKPFLLKAVALRPKNLDALNNLKSYYLGTKNPDKANETQKQIDAAQAGGGN